MEQIQNILVECPHCKDPVLIEKLNCCISSRSIKCNGKQIDTHSPKELCDFILKQI